jgi:hypothetical protein
MTSIGLRHSEPNAANETYRDELSARAAGLHAYHIQTTAPFGCNYDKEQPFRQAQPWDVAMLDLHPAPAIPDNRNIERRHPPASRSGIIRHVSDVNAHWRHGLAILGQYTRNC